MTVHKVIRLNMLTQEEREKILFSFNDTSVSFRGKQLYHELFSDQAATSPDQIAVVSETEAITYYELQVRSDQMANLLFSAGVKRHDLIGLCLERSVEMIVSILGILKAGAAYLPIDPEYPAERINFMVEDSGIKVIISTMKTLEKAGHVFSGEKGLNVITVDTPSQAISDPTAIHTITGDPTDLAYVIYTSGSTGRPKGVMNEHAGLVNRLKWAQSYFGLDSHDVVLQKTTFCFDVSVWELLWPLMVGAKLVFAKPGGQKDGNYLEWIINEQKITTIHFVPSMLEVFLLALDKGACKSLKRVLCSGEELTDRQAQLFREKLGHSRLFNLYGPTEAAIDVSCFEVPKQPGKILIGKPVANTSLYILNQLMEPCPLGTEGELYIGGVQVARGYLNRPELNKDRFLSNPFATGIHTRLYRTGDKARWHPDGNIEYLGRADDQVKIRGFRIEPGEIENTILEFGSIKQCVVDARKDRSGEKKLIAYVVGSASTFDKSGLYTHLKNNLPDYMVPVQIIEIDEIPLTSNGKIDKRSLPEPEYKRPELATLYKAPSTPTEQLIAELWSRLLNIDKVGVNDNFFELGGNSLLAVRFVAALKQNHNLILPVTRLYQFPRIHAIASYLGGKDTFKFRPAAKKTSPGGDIAVIGMAGRFPGANTLDELWSVLSAGKETTSFFSNDELDKSIPEELIRNPAYVKARGVISHVKDFDAAFFGMNNRMAELMDPQQRIFLEVAWEALESSGHLPEKYDGKIGVFAGSGSNTYYLNNVHTRPDLIASVGSFQVSTLNEKDYIAMRTAYELNLKGPAVSVYSACSTSLLAIVQATESLRKGQCDIALAGGVAITSPINSGHLYEEGAMLSRDGHCRPFDAEASGTVFSDGAGIVLLKTLTNAERDGDKIYAIIKGVGLNNDGSGKASFTAPDPAGQADAISMAIGDASIESSSISYIETHGTATPLGDPIEIEALKLAFGPQDNTQFCAIGSIKSNMGHLTHAAGVAGFIKTVLALNFKQIPPSLFFNTPNPNIEFNNSPFYVNSNLAPWSSNGPRRAGVSSFGVGGTNVHVVLEEFPEEFTENKQPAKMQLINWSARTEESLNAYQKKLADYLIKTPSLLISDIAATLQQTRRDFAHRRFIIAADTADLVSKLNMAGQGTDTRVSAEDATEVAFIFPGQGSQYPNMGLELYLQEDVFKRAIDECAEILAQWLDVDIRTVLYANEASPEPTQNLHNTRYTQPALFVTEYAMARLWMSWGIIPAALSGHSIGEFVAAHLAGIFSLTDVLKVVAERARLTSELPLGSMLAVKINYDELKKLIPKSLSIAAINSSELTVVSGPIPEIKAFSELMAEKGKAAKTISTSHAFHSSMMDDVLDTFRAVVSSVSLSIPKIPLVSTVTGTWMSEAQATSHDYWVTQVRLPVRFADAITTLWEDSTRLLLEVGPGNASTIFARQQAKGRPLVAVPGFEIGGTYHSEYGEVLRSLGKLWQSGIIPDWKSISNGSKINLPTYAFDRKTCWIEPGLGNYDPVIPRAEHITEFASPLQLTANDNRLRKDILTRKIKEILEDASGIDMRGIQPDLNFIEIGLDSLLLTQIAITLKRQFSVAVSFRQLNENLNSVNLLAEFLDNTLPPDFFEPGTSTSQRSETGQLTQQIEDLSRKSKSIQNSGTKTASLSASDPMLNRGQNPEIQKPFGASPRIEKQPSNLSPKQAAFLKILIERYNEKTKASKEFTQRNRPHMADPRVVSGFRPVTKELVYPIVAKYSKGSKIWDIDDNEYIDALNGFGSNMLGYQPDIIVTAIKEQMDKGYEIGPQHELAGDVCKLICDFTNFERAALCSTGSEAVLGAMRIARTVTGRSLIVAFSGSYHGIFDEVIIRGTKTFRSIPAAPGIMPEAVQNMLVLDYGTDDTLNILRERAHELAAVLVEPVQSRRPDFQPVEFLKEVRKITEASGTVLIFDEVITGFRMHPGGAQAMFNIKADIASYGKVIGGGLPIGVIAGQRKFMDALDGGLWQYGDDSSPDAGVTYFAGTFVRHPLALVAAKTSLEYFRSKGLDLQQDLNSKAADLMDSLNNIGKELQIPVQAVGFGSMWKLRFTEEIPYSELLFTLMRDKGIHILDGFPCFLTEAHTLHELLQISKAFKESAEELIKAGFLHPVIDKSLKFANLDNINEAPVPGAKLGRDKDGNPAWFIADPGNPGRYLQIKHKD